MHRAGFGAGIPSSCCAFVTPWQNPQQPCAALHTPLLCSELTAVWASTIWPEASILNANTGAPRVVRACRGPQLMCITCWATVRLSWAP